MKALKALGLALDAAALAASGSPAQGTKRDKVRIATEGSYAPWNFTGPAGKLDGF